MTTNDHDLLASYLADGSEEAFAAMVNRHLNLVYSAALRQVRSPQLAEEVSQSVFTDLARNADKLKPDTILTAWLYQVTRRTAIDVVRRESRRQARERIATEMAAMNTATDWTQIEPLLDEGMEALDETDRTAILLRYFDNKSLREVGEVLGTSDDAAQKRVSRAVERLREFLGKRGIAVGASALVAILSANAVQAAPASLAVTVLAATVTGTTIATTAATATATATTTILMTTLQKTLFTAVVAAAIGVGVFQARQNSQLRDRIETLQQQQTPLTKQVEDLQKEKKENSNRLALLTEENAKLKKQPAEVMKLRSTVGRLQQENAAAGKNSMVNQMISDPETRKAMREQQKMGMTMIYGDFIKNQKLSKEQAAKLKDLLADGVMDGVDQVTAVRRDGVTGPAMEKVFADQDAAFQEKVGALLGPDGLAQYQEYTKNLASHLSTQQFEDQLSGDKAAKDEKTKQLYQLMQNTAQQAIADAGLPADYQLIPMLNFRNIASEDEAEKSLKLLSDVYQSTANQARSFLNEEELKKFQDFSALAVTNNRMALTINRKAMSPTAAAK